MKIVILAADSSSFAMAGKRSIPKCLLEIDGKSVLERIIMTLNYSGYPSEIISVVVGEGGPWSNKINIDKIREIHDSIIFNPINVKTGSSFSLLLALKEIGIDDQVIVIDGDLIFRNNLLNQLDSTKNLLLTRRSLSLSETGGFVYVNGNKVIGASPVEMPEDIANCTIYSGIGLFQPSILANLLKALLKNKKEDLLCAVNTVCSEHDIFSIDYTTRSSNSSTSGSYNSDLVGGSYATLKKSVVVRKDARGKGIKKLRNEILWLQNLNLKIKKYFPEVLHFHDGKNHIWFEMPYYDIPNLRELIMLGEYNSEKVVEFLKKVLDFMFEKVYSNVIQPAPHDWSKIHYIHRINLRLIDSMKIFPEIEKFIYAKRIILNGTPMRNLSDILLDLSKRPEFLKVHSGENLRMVHGDLHFQNLLVNDNNNEVPFILADPRGTAEGSSIYYDLGKLWHSVNGLYDFLHTEQFKLEWKEVGEDIEVTLAIDNTKAMDIYIEVKNQLLSILSSYKLLENDKNLDLKIHFAEMAHFGSVLPFHLHKEGNNHKGIAMYVTAVKLFNEFIERFDLSAWPQDNSYININLLNDYKRALQKFSLSKEDIFDGLGERIRDLD